jgi:hypothetical protein
MTAIPADIPTGTHEDVSDQINSWIAKSPRGSVLDFAATTYRCEKELLIRDNQDIAVLSHGATIRSQNKDHIGAYWKLEDSDRILLDAAFTYGNKPASAGYQRTKENQHLIEIQSCIDVRLTRLKGYNFFGDCVYISHHGYRTHRISKNIHIGKLDDSKMACNFGESGRGMLTVTGGDNVYWWGGSAGGIGQHALILGGDGGGPATNIGFFPSKIGAHRGFGFVTGPGDGAVTHVRIGGFTQSGVPFTVLVPPCEGVRADYNIFDIDASDTEASSPNGNVMEFNFVHGLYVANIKQPMTRKRPMQLIETNYCTDVDIDRAVA